jgi:hypothetical protein
MVDIHIIKVGRIQEERHKVEQFHKKWNCSTFSESRASNAVPLYEKVEQALKAGHGLTKCGTATHILVLLSQNSEGMIRMSRCFRFWNSVSLLSDFHIIADLQKIHESDRNSQSGI